MTHLEIVDVVRFLFPNKSLLFQDEKVLQVEAKFTSTNSQSDAIAALADQLMVARTIGLTGQQVNLLIVELRQLTHV